VRRVSVWWIWLVIGAVLSATSLIWPQWTWNFAAFTGGIGLLAAGVAVGGAFRLRRPQPVVWIFLALGIGFNASGSVVETIYFEVLHRTTWPTPSLGFYVLLYPCLAVSVSLIVRHQARDNEWSHLVDSLIITAGLGLLCWVALIRAALGDPLATMMERTANVVFPIGDLVIISTLVRLLLRGGWRSPALRLLTISIGLFLLTDGAWSMINQLGLSPGRWAQGMLTMTPMLAYVFAAAAPLHPSAQELGQPDGEGEYELGGLLLAALSAACLIAPAILLVEVIRGDVTDGLSIAIGAAALTLLVIARMAELVRRVQQQAEQLKELASEDPLTGLANRRAMARRLSSEMELARRRPSSLAVALLDLDFFKKYNDSRGHAAGDELLRSASARWCNGLRSSDFLARMGGEEFLLVLPEIEPTAAQDLIARLQGLTPDGQTFSAGLAFWDGQETSEELIARADIAMYQAKSTGRARTCAAVTDRPAWPLVGSGVFVRAGTAM
jgi:diguanylate cyclase (GGDEF)-like protein